MSFPPGTFHVYVIQNPTSFPYGYISAFILILQDSKLVPRDQTPSFSALAAFPSRAAADEFWRAGQESPDNNPQDPEACRRYNAQYTRIPVPWLQLRLTGWNVPCFVQLLGGGASGLVAPPQPQPDNISGRGFYIRSVARPNLYWHLNSTRIGITLSSTHQTRFIIRRATPLPFECRPEEDILIGSDDINIFLVMTGREPGYQGEMIVRASCNELFPESRVHGASAEDRIFKFSRFSGGFAAYPSVGTTLHGPIHVTVEPMNGERWEFVE